jgi:Mn-dependent DtxR family transcriptional regulator
MQRLAKALQKEGLIEKIKRGEYRLTEQGLAATSF